MLVIHPFLLGRLAYIKALRQNRDEELSCLRVSDLGRQLLPFTFMSSVQILFSLPHFGYDHR